MDNKVENFKFQAEINKLMHLVSNSLYSNKEIFIRELISNASDAIEKLHFLALKDSSVYDNNNKKDINITVSISKSKNIITISDDGVGMDKNDLINNIGTIAASGTKKFLKTLENKDQNIIGQFGVGFYSSFIVADEVIIKSKKNNSEGFLWKSNGKDGFIIEKCEKNNRGTDVILHIKNSEKDFLDSYRIRELLNKYSSYISSSIIFIDNDSKEKKKENIDKKQPIWKKNKNELKDSDYINLYKQITFDYEDPTIWTHNKVEGKINYSSIFFIPKKSNIGLNNYQNSGNELKGIKLYIQNIFIMDNLKYFLPMYLRFIKGIIESNDLSLNVSREMLQEDKNIKSISKYCVKKVLDMIENLSKNKEKYTIFWKDFGNILKEGITEDFNNQKRIAKLLRFSSTKQREKVVSLNEYISRKKENQKSIYYLLSNTFETGANSPHLEIFKKNDIEVLLMYDRVDEWLVNSLSNFDNINLESISDTNININNIIDNKNNNNISDNKEFHDVIKKIKDVLPNCVKEVKITNKLEKFPSCLTNKDKMSINFQLMMKEAGQNVPESGFTLEINPKHKIVKYLQNNQDSDVFKDVAYLLYEEALLNEGCKISEPSSFIERINKFIKL